MTTVVLRGITIRVQPKMGDSAKFRPKFSLTAETLTLAPFFNQILRRNHASLIPAGSVMDASPAQRCAHRSVAKRRECPQGPLLPRDAVAMVKFFVWLEKEVAAGRPVTECSAAVQGQGSTFDPWDVSAVFVAPVAAECTAFPG